VIRRGTRAWLHALLRPDVTQVVAWDPRKNARLKVGSKNRMAGENHRSLRTESYHQQLDALLSCNATCLQEFTGFLGLASSDE
jgi:hypothetical protein